MAFPEKNLGEGEHVVIHTRTHWKALVWPTVFLIVTAGVAGFLLSLGGPDWVRWVIIGVALVVIVLLVVVPYLRWMSSTDTITNHRLITRSGVIARTGRDIPLRKINDVTLFRGPLDRILGCGTLTVESAGERGRIILHDVPAAQSVHVRLQELLMDVAVDDGYDTRRVERTDRPDVPGSEPPR